MRKETNISREEFFRLCCCACDDVIRLEEFHNENCKEALVRFSRKLEDKLFAAPAERYYTPQRVQEILADVKRTGEYPTRRK